jgi:hypothetical protein
MQSMVMSEAIRVLRAALVAIEAGNLEAAKKLIAQVIAGLQVRKHR